MDLSKVSFDISPVMSSFYGTESEIWADFGQLVSLEFMNFLYFFDLIWFCLNYVMTEAKKMLLKYIDLKKVFCMIFTRHNLMVV